MPSLNTLGRWIGHYTALAIWYLLYALAAVGCFFIASVFLSVSLLCAFFFAVVGVILMCASYFIPKEQGWVAPVLFPKRRFVTRRYN